jgi:hypothetical protein
MPALAHASARALKREVKARVLWPAPFGPPRSLGSENHRSAVRAPCTGETGDAAATHTAAATAWRFNSFRVHHYSSRQLPACRPPGRPYPLQTREFCASNSPAQANSAGTFLRMIERNAARGPLFVRVVVKSSAENHLRDCQTPLEPRAGSLVSQGRGLTWRGSWLDSRSASGNSSPPTSTCRPPEAAARAANSAAPAASLLHRTCNGECSTQIQSWRSCLAGIGHQCAADQHDAPDAEQELSHVYLHGLRQR